MKTFSTLLTRLICLTAMLCAWPAAAQTFTNAIVDYGYGTAAPASAMKIGPDGKIYCLWLDGGATVVTGSPGVFKLIRWNTTTSAWDSVGSFVYTAPGGIDTNYGVGPDCPLEIDSSGGFHMTYIAPKASPLGNAVYYAYSADGTSWAFTELINYTANNDGPGQVELSLDQNNRPHVFYLRRNVGEGGGPPWTARVFTVMHHSFNGSAWASEIAYTQNGGSGTGYNDVSLMAATLDHNGKGHLAFSYESNGSGTDASLGYVTNAGGSWSAVQKIAAGSTGAPVVQGIAITVDASNKVHIIRQDPSCNLFYHTNKSGNFTSAQINGNQKGTLKNGGRPLVFNSLGDLFFPFSGQVDPTVVNPGTIRYACLFSGTTTWQVGDVMTAGVNKNTGHTMIAAAFTPSRLAMVTFSHFTNPAGASPGTSATNNPINSRQLQYATATVLPAGANSVPTVTTAAQSNVTHNSATLGGNVTADGGTSVTDRGIVWGLSANPTTANTKVANGTGTGVFTATVSGLPASTLVHVRAYATNSASTSYGSDISFTTNATPVPEIDVSGNDSPITDGANLAAASTTNDTDFGTVPVAGVTLEKTYTISNSGTAALNLTGGPNFVSVSPAGAFSVTQQPTSPVAANGGTTTFKITYDPSANGAASATVSFGNNDADENPFDFVVKGTGSGTQTFDLAGNPISNTPYDGGESYIFVILAPEINVKGNNTTIADNDVTPTLNDHTDFGAVAVGGTIVRTFTIENTGNTGLNLTGTPKVVVAGIPSADYTITTPPVSPVAMTNGTTTFQVTFAPSWVGLRLVLLHIANDDGNENPYNFNIQGTGTCPTIEVANPGTSTGTAGLDFSQTFTQSGGFGSTTFSKTGALPAGITLASTGELSGTPAAGSAGSYSIIVTATDSLGCTGAGTAYALVISDPPPIAPVGFTIGGVPGDATTDSDAPDYSGNASVGKFETQVRGGFLAENGSVVFPAQLQIGSGSPAVTNANFQGIWKDDSTGLVLLARSGFTAPGTNGELFGILPMISAISDAGDVTFYASLPIGGMINSGNDTALWTEIGGDGLRLLVREGDSVNNAVTGASINAFASGAFATATLSGFTGTAAYSVTLKGSTTDTAIIRSNVSGATITHTLVAKENSPAPGTAENFYNVAGGYSDPGRMDSQGNFAFAAFLKPSFKEGIWYQPNGGALTKAIVTGDTAPDTGGATFYNYYLEQPAMGGNGTFAFHAFLNADGDNTANDKNDGIWRGNTTSGFNCILRRGDTNASRPGLGLPSAGAKVGNLFSPWLSNANHAALLGWVDINGDGVSSFGTDAFGHFTDTSGTMKLVIKIGDAVPGVAGAVFTGTDLPIVGGQEQMAFVGTFTGPGVTAGVNNAGIWRESPNGGPLQLVLRTGDTITTSQGVKTIYKIDFPGTGQGGYAADHRWEQQVMDSTGRIVLNITFTDGTTSQIFAP